MIDDGHHSITQKVQSDQNTPIVTPAVEIKTTASVNTVELPEIDENKSNTVELVEAPTSELTVNSL